MISDQFGPYTTPYTNYDSHMLNQSVNIINQSIASGNPVAPGYLLATLQAFNATTSYRPNDVPVLTQPSPTPRGDGGSTGLAMSVVNNTSLTHSHLETDDFRIILYAITGCVSALFCVVIISGVCIFPLYTRRIHHDVICIECRRFVLYVIPNGTDPD